MRVKMTTVGPTGSPEGDPRPGGLSTDATSAGHEAFPATREAIVPAFKGRRVKARPSQAPRGSVVAKRGANVGDHPSAHDHAAVGSVQGPRHRMMMVLGLLAAAVAAAVGSLVRTSPLGTSLGKSGQLRTSHLEENQLEMAGKEARQPVEGVRPPATVQRPLQGVSSRHPLRQLSRAPCQPEG